MTNILPSVEEVVAEYEAVLKNYTVPSSSWIRKLLKERDAYWQQHEHDMYESVEAAHQEAMGEMVREILEINIQSAIDFAMYQSKVNGYVDDERVKRAVGIQDEFRLAIKAIARSRGVLDNKQ
jgi:hypothetical protein